MKHLVLIGTLAATLLAVRSSPARAAGDGLVRNPVATTLVFVANGSGDQNYVSDALCRLTWENSLPLYTVRVAWSRTAVGTLDLHDKAGQKLAAERLAGTVLAARACNPHAAIHLVGHSAGAHVVLAAAGLLPPGTIQRIVLLAAAVSRKYDLRPALRAACEGIDSFYSKTDCTLLAVETICLTADGHKALTAGRVGFAPACACDPLYEKLRQHPHDACMKKSHHSGGHYGCTRAPFLMDFVVPLLTCQQSGGR